MGDVFLVKFVKLAPISNHLADLTMDESPWTPGLSLCWVGIITLTLEALWLLAGTHCWAGGLASGAWSSSISLKQEWG